MSDIDARLAELEQRVQALEDELEIHRTITTYGLAVDVGDADRAAWVYTEDTMFDVDGKADMAGRKGVRAMVRGSGHQSLLPDCAHTIGPAVVKLMGKDKAVATSYSRIYHREGDAFRLFRLAFNRFTMEKRDGRWQIKHRKATQLGNPGAPDIFKQSIKELIPDPPKGKRSCHSSLRSESTAARQPAGLPRLSRDLAGAETLPPAPAVVSAPHIRTGLFPAGALVGGAADPATSPTRGRVPAVQQEERSPRASVR